jgi:hypothetical protein
VRLGPDGLRGVLFERQVKAAANPHTWDGPFSNSVWCAVSGSWMDLAKTLKID